MDLTNSLETITLNEKTNYRLMEIGKIKDYFDQEKQYQQDLTSKLGKYLTYLDYADKILTVILTVFAHVKTGKQLLGLITSVFSLVSCLSSGIIKKITTRNKIRNKKHNRLLYLAKNKLDCVKMLISKSVEN